MTANYNHMEQSVVKGSSLAESPKAKTYIKEVSTNEWSYSLIPRAYVDATFSPFGAFFAGWHVNAIKGKTPEKRIVKFHDLKDWLGWMRVLRYQGPDPKDGVYTLWGSLIVSQTGVEWTGKTLGETVGQTPSFMTREREYHKSLMTGDYIGMVAGRLEHDRHKYQYVEILELPFTDGSAPVSHLISAVRRLPDRAVGINLPKEAITL